MKQKKKQLIAKSLHGAIKELKIKAENAKAAANEKRKVVISSALTPVRRVKHCVHTIKSPLTEKEAPMLPGEKELRKLGYASYLGNSTFANVDNIVRMAKLKPDYGQTLKYLLDYYTGTIYKYIINKYVLEFVTNELATKHSWNYNDHYLAALVKDQTGIFNAKGKSSFSFLNEKLYLLRWEDVRFRKGAYTIYAPTDGSVSFAALDVPDKLSVVSLNYIRDYLQNKMPRISCTVEKGRLHIDTPIDLGIAIRMLQTPTYSKIAEERRVAASRPKLIVFPDDGIMSYKDSVSKASQMSREDFIKYKSKFVSYLLKRQISDYKIIPCNENISHKHAIDAIENAFIFTLQSKSDSRAVIVVIENLNPDRATLLFKLRKSTYEDSLKVIHSFLKSPEINKRSNLRERIDLISALKAEDFYAVNHRDDGPFPWFSTMDYRLRTM